MSGNKSENGVSKFVNKEFSGMVLLLFSAFVLFCIFTGNKFFNPLGLKLQFFFMGTLGYFCFPLFIFLLLYSLMLIVGKSVVGGRATNSAIKLILITFAVFCLIHLILYPIGEITFKEYLSEAYKSPKNNYSLDNPNTVISDAQFGGAFFALIVYGSVKGLSAFGAYVLFIALIIILTLFFLKDFLIKEKPVRQRVSNSDEEKGQGANSFTSQEPISQAPQREIQAQQPINVYYGAPPVSVNQGVKREKRNLVVGNSSFELKNDEDYTPRMSFKSPDLPYEKESTPYNGATFYSDTYNSSVANGSNYVKQTQKINTEAPKPKYVSDYEPPIEEELDSPIFDDFDSPKEFDDLYIPENYKDSVKQEIFDSVEEDLSEIVEEQVNSASDDNLVDITKLSEQTFDFDSHDEEIEEPEMPELFKPSVQARKAEVVRPTVTPKQASKEKTEQLRFNTQSLTEKEEDVNPIDTMPFNYKFNAPPTSLLNVYDSTNDYGQIEAFKMGKAEKIMSVLKVLGGIEVKVVNIVDGPTVTRFDIAIPENVTVKAVLKYSEDLKLRLATEEEIRIAPVRGTPYIGIEIPNAVKKIVGLREIVESEAFKSAKPTSLTFAIGKDLVGNAVVTDICKMPHLLVAGSTGTGKSVGLNSMLVSLMMKYSPADLRFIIVDPKMVEFAVFENSPHMLFNEILFTSEKAVSMLDWAVEEMDARYMLFRKALVQGIDDYNAQLDTRKHHKMYRIVIIIDEFADLMSKNKKQIEEKIARIAQKARAAGIYLILATQRPSVNIMEGSIKTNFTSRMAFKMSNAIDSQTILGEAGAEKLLGKGDLLYRTSTMPNVERAQGAFVSMDEIKKVMAYIKDNNTPYYNEAAHKKINHEDEPQIESVTGKNAGDDGRVPPDYVKALRFAVESKTISISLIQRRLGYGFPKAAKIFDWMIENKYVLNSQTGKQKQVVLSLEEFEEEFGQYDI